MINEGMFTCNSIEWGTPQKLFDELNKEFNFTLDPCANESNHKCDKYFTKEDDGLSKSWERETVFVNPPYGRDLPKWVEKCYNEHIEHNITVVMLIPARTDTSYFHDYIYNYSEIRFIRGRLKFNDGKNPAPFPSMIVVYRARNTKKRK